MNVMTAYDLSPWELLDKEPDEAFLKRMIEREGYEASIHQLAPGPKTDELRYEQPVVYTVIEGRFQVALPGYSVLELKAGDQLCVYATILHDLTALGSQPSRYWRHFKG